MSLQYLKSLIGKFVSFVPFEEIWFRWIQYQWNSSIEFLMNSMISMFYVRWEMFAFVWIKSLRIILDIRHWKHVKLVAKNFIIFQQKISFMQCKTIRWLKISIRLFPMYHLFVSLSFADHNHSWTSSSMEFERGLWFFWKSFDSIFISVIEN